MRFILVGLLCLLFAIPSPASDFTLGADGYYYQNGVPHTRSSVWNPGYYTYDYRGCGYYNQGYYSYTYSPVTISQKTITYETPDWRSKLLDLKAAQNKAQAKLLKDAFEQQYFLESVRQLGFEGNGFTPAFPLRNFSLGGGYSTGNVQFGAFGSNASTIYGVSHYLDAYGDTSIIAQWQAANQHVAAAQNNASQAVGGFQTLLKTDIDGRARVAETLARAEATQRFLAALAVPQAKLTTNSIQVQPATPNGANNNPPAPQMPLITDPRQSQQGTQNTLADGYKAWEQSAVTRCAKCHFSKEGDKKALKGGFDVSTFPALTADKRTEIVQKWLRTGKMPLDENGKGVMMPENEIKLWEQNFVLAQPNETKK